MARKILILMLVISLIIVPNIRNNPEAHANPVLKEAVKIVVKQAIKKETKSAVESQLIKSGVRTIEKTALEKANERWFQRLAADEVASLTKAVERATPAGTPGWLKIVVGAGMFATGADLAFDIYDALAGKSDVDYYTDDATLGGFGRDPAGDRIVGINGYTLGFEYYNDKNSAIWGPKYRPFLQKGEEKIYQTTVYASNSVMFDKFFFIPSTNENTTIGGKPFIIIYLKTFVSGYTKDSSGQTEYHYNDSPQNRGYFLIPAGTTDGYYHVNGNDGAYQFDPAAKSQPQTFPMPADQADLWPGETEAVEITFPDPDFFPDTTQTIIDNPQIVTNPIPEPQPTPEPSPSIEPTASPAPSPSVGPTGQPNPSAEPTLSPSSTPVPSVAPSSKPTVPPVIGGEDPNPTTPPGEGDDDDDGYNGPVIDSPLTPEEALAIGWEDVTPPLIKEYKDPKTGTIVKFNTKTLEITYTKYFGVDIVNTGGKKLGEIDEIDIENQIFYEDKSAKGLSTINPTTGLPSLTPQQWADKQIRDKTRVRINSALKEGTATRPTPEGSKIVPDIELFRNYREFIFRMEADSLELRQATENALNDLRQEFPDYKFSATFGGGI